jgi:DNA-binding transcriptional ArsR family regulator
LHDFLNITKALSDENRVRVLMFLETGEMCVCQLIEMLALAPSTVSKHMSILLQAGLVRVRKDGRWVYYDLPDRDAPAAVRAAVDMLQSCLRDRPQIISDAQRLEKVRATDLDKLCSHYRQTDQ